MQPGRNTARRDRFRRIIRRGEPPCHLCGEAIDYQAEHLDPLSFTIDHVTPLARGGTDTLDNIAAAHRKCNRDKGATAPTLLPGGVTFVTHRKWTP